MWKICCFTMLAALTLSSQTFNQPFDEVNPPSGAAPLTQSVVTQTRTRVHLILMLMMQPGASGDSLSQQLADSMLALALPERQPARSELTAFTLDLAKALNGKVLNGAQGTTLQECIVDLLRAENVTNYQLAERLRETLSAAGINDPSTDLIVRRFLLIGEAVRGPDDQGLAPRK